MGLVFLIDRPGYRLATDRKVLKRNDAVVIEEITQAYVRAQGEINSALANVEKACAKATDDAYKKGLAKAEHEAARHWTLVEVERVALLKSMQPVLAELIVEALSLLAQDIDRQAFLSRALESLQSSLRTVSWARLRVRPEMVPEAEAALTDFERRTGLGRLARVVADDSLPKDGCVLESELGRVDAGLSVQLEAIRGAVTDAVRMVGNPL